MEISQFGIFADCFQKQFNSRAPAQALGNGLIIRDGKQILEIFLQNICHFVGQKLYFIAIKKKGRIGIMSERELKKEFTEKWRKDNPTKYIIWQIFYFADIIPVVVILTQITGRMNDKKVATIGICLAVCLVLGIICIIISSEQKRDWKIYLEQNRHRLNK